MKTNIQNLRFTGLLLALFLFQSATPLWGQSGLQGGLVSAVPPENLELAEGIEAALKGDVKEAVKYFVADHAKRPSHRPGGIDAAMAFADPSFDFKHFGKLRFWLEKTAEDYPDDPEAFLLLADIALSESRCLECALLTDHAVALVKNLGQNSQRTPSLRKHITRLQASVAEQRERWAEAAALLAQLQKDEPENGEFALRRGVALYRLGQKEEALKALHEAAANDRRMLPPLIVLAQLAEFDGNTEQATKLLEEAVAEQGTDPRVLTAAADMELKWNHLDKVRQLIEKAQGIDPTSVDAEMILGILDLYDSHYDKAGEKFLRVVQAQPQNSRALTGLALALSEQNDRKQTQRAFTIAKRNADQNPSSVDAQSTLAWVLVKAGASEEAEKILRRQFDSGDMNSPAAYYLAEIYAASNRKDEAILFLKSALKTNTNFPKRTAAEKLLKLLLQ